MIEYIFFHQKPFDLFCRFLRQENIVFNKSKEETDVEGWLVALPDDLDVSLSGRIECLYDELLGMDESLVIEDPENTIDQAGLAVCLKSGVSVFASVDPDVLNRMLTVVTRDEVAEFIDAVVSAVETPDQSPLCQRKKL